MWSGRVGGGGGVVVSDFFVTQNQIFILGVGGVFFYKLTRNLNLTKKSYFLFFSFFLGGGGGGGTGKGRGRVSVRA